MKESFKEDEDPEPNYNISLGQDYQDYVTFMFMGNRSETFGTFFNKFFQALEDYDEALLDYRNTTIVTYNRRLDSLNITPPISSAGKEKLNKVIERCSKIIQYNKNTRFIADAVLLIGKSYYYMGDYLQAERKFSEFLSKLTKSRLYDEAILYLGKTKFRLNKQSEGETLLLNLLNNTPDNEIKSDIAQELGSFAISKNNFQDAVINFQKSIDFTKDNEKKSERTYILAKIYSTYKPELAYDEYKKAENLTSDFDLVFYSRLNEGKSLLLEKKYSEAFKILDKMDGKYRDYPEFKQFVEYELANLFFEQNKFKEAKKRYFDVIMNYSGTKCAADSYYKLAKYAEYSQNNYLNAYINYKRVIETSTGSDYYNISNKRAISLDKYFTLIAVIKDTTKIVYPTENPEFEKYKKKVEEEKGLKKDQRNPNDPNNPNNPPPKESNPPGKENPKGGGNKIFLNTTAPEQIGELKKDLVVNIKPQDSLGVNKKDSLGNLNEIIKKDSIKVSAKDTLLNFKKGTTDTTKETVKISPYDSLILAIKKEDSIKTAKESIKINAYFQLAELFLYDLERSDSALHYLNIILNDNATPEQYSKAMYTVATIYKNQNNLEEANSIFKKIISLYPNTIFANESRRILGLPLTEIEKDSAEVMYKNVENKIQSKNYDDALNILKLLIVNYPQDSLTSKAIYTIGWLYENIFFNKDSSLKYYKKLQDVYPSSQYAMAIFPKIEYYASIEKKDSVIINNDSLKTQNDTTKIISDSTKLFNPDSINTNIETRGIIKDSSEIKIPEKQKESETGEEKPPVNITPDLVKPNEEIKK